jgi:hypothetical protein
MNRHYTEYLIKKYQPMFKTAERNPETDKPPHLPFYLFLFEVGDGWFNIINTLCGLICSDWLYAKEQHDYLQSRVGKPRYDFGKEHQGKDIVTEEDVAEAKAVMDEEAERIPVVTQVKEKYGGLRFYVFGATDEQYALIRFAESMSYGTCEVCGNVGKPNRGGWVRTRCKEHEDD